jgi:hypothetical protein
MNSENRRRIQDKISVVRSWTAIRNHLQRNPISDPQTLHEMIQKILDVELSQLFEALNEEFE